MTETAAEQAGWPVTPASAEPLTGAVQPEPAAPATPGEAAGTRAPVRNMPGPAASHRAVTALPGSRRVPVVQARTGTEGRGMPYHVAVAVGAAAGIYAVSLAAVTALQAGTDASVEAARRPTVEAIAALRASHDGLEAAVARIEAGYVDAVDSYDALATRLAGHETALGELSTVTGKIEGTAAALPGTIRLPALSRATTRVSSRPATNATTTASGKP